MKSVTCQNAHTHTHTTTYTRVQKHTHTHIHIHTHTHSHAYPNKHIRARIHIHTNTLAYASNRRIHTHKHTCALTHEQTGWIRRQELHEHKHTHLQTDKHMHKHTHTHTIGPPDVYIRTSSALMKAPVRSVTCNWWISQPPATFPRPTVSRPPARRTRLSVEFTLGD